jgi:hypothetical protein
LIRRPPANVRIDTRPVVLPLWRRALLGITGDETHQPVDCRVAMWSEDDIQKTPTHVLQIDLTLIVDLGEASGYPG